MRRTTVALDERVYERIKQKSRLERRHFQDCANELLLLGLKAADKVHKKFKPVRVFSCGVPRIDVADREALFDLLDSE